MLVSTGVDMILTSSLQFVYELSLHQFQPKIIRRHGYPAESYFVQTEDGYLLEMHRIPYGKKGPKYGKKEPVFLQHGVFGSSADWVVAGPDTALGKVRNYCPALDGETNQKFFHQLVSNVRTVDTKSTRCQLHINIECISNLNA